MIFEVNYELKIDDATFTLHQERIDVKKMEDPASSLITIFVGEDQYQEDAHFLDVWSPEFRIQAPHNEIDLREFDGNGF